jgi:iron(III) transport system permease protein
VKVLGNVLLAAALAVAVGWPALATTLEVMGLRGAESGTVPSAGPIGPLPFTDTTLARPLALARNTLELVLATEAVALPAGIALAVLLVRTDMAGRRPLLASLALAVFIPLPLHATAWLGAFGNQGRVQLFTTKPILVGLPGAAFVQGMAALPWVTLLVGVGLRGVEPELEEAAVLDWPAWRVVLGVSLRRSVGAIAGAALAVAVLTAGDMTVTDLLRVRTFAEEAYLQANLKLGNGPEAVAVVALPPLVVLGTLVLLAARALLRADPARLPSPRSRARTWRLGRWRFGVGAVVVAIVGNAVALPIYGLIWRAGWVGRLGGKRWTWPTFRKSIGASWEDLAPNVSQLLRHPSWYWQSPLLNSLIWSAAGATATLLVAWPLAWKARRPGAWAWVAAGVVALLLATPGPAAGLALVLAYRSVPIVYNTPVVLVLVDILRTLPYAMLVLWPALRTFPEDYLEAAALDGLSPGSIVRRIVIPLTRAPALAAWGVAFALAMGELPAYSVVELPGTETATKLVWSLLHTGVESRLSGIALILLAVVGAAGLPAAWALRRVYGTGQAEIS